MAEFQGSPFILRGWTKVVVVVGQQRMVGSEDWESSRGAAVPSSLWKGSSWNAEITPSIQGDSELNSSVSSSP